MSFDPQTLPTLPTTEAPSWITWVIGLLIVAISALAGTVAYLFKLYHRRTGSHEKQIRELENGHSTERGQWLQERTTWSEERAAWDAEREAERERDRADYEMKFRELIVRYDEIARKDRDAHLAREESIRREYADLMERISLAESKRSASELALLEKLSSRFSGRRRTGD